MSGIVSHSRRVSLVERRRQLRQQRYSERWRLIWRFGLTAGLCTGCFVLLQQPWWLLEGEHQLEVLGLVRLRDREVLDLLPLHYPVPIWAIQPQQLEASLRHYPLIQSAAVERRLLPLGVRITLVEREPLATSTLGTVPGVVDRAGVWVPQNIYTDLPQLPSLRIEGYESQPPEQWQVLLALVGRSPITIQMLDWQDPNNVILETELGRVHLGSLLFDETGTSEQQLQRQLQALDQLRELEQHCQCERQDIDYIDLRNPNNPTISLTESAAAQRFAPPIIE